MPVLRYLLSIIVNLIVTYSNNFAIKLGKLWNFVWENSAIEFIKMKNVEEFRADIGTGKVPAAIDY